MEGFNGPVTQDGRKPLLHVSGIHTRTVLSVHDPHYFYIFGEKQAAFQDFSVNQRQKQKPTTKLNLRSFLFMLLCFSVLRCRLALVENHNIDDARCCIQTNNLLAPLCECPTEAAASY